MLLLIFIGLINVSCGEDISQDCEGDNAQPVEQFFDGEFKCRLQNFELSDKESNLVIKNQTDYEKYVTCNDGLTNIDFDNHFILAGVFSHHQCAVFDNQSVVLCENRLIYRVRILEQICMAATGVQYFTVIDKKYENMKIEFDIQLIKSR